SRPSLRVASWVVSPDVRYARFTPPNQSGVDVDIVAGRRRGALRDYNAVSRGCSPVAAVLGQQPGRLSIRPLTEFCRFHCSTGTNTGTNHDQERTRLAGVVLAAGSGPVDLSPSWRRSGATSPR